jgi:hypothetical protein
MTKKTLSILNYDFRNKEERELFREQENALLAEQKRDIISGLKRDGLLDGQTSPQRSSRSATWSVCAFNPNCFMMNVSMSTSVLFLS